MKNLRKRAALAAATLVATAGLVAVSAPTAEAAVGCRTVMGSTWAHAECYTPRDYRITLTCQQSLIPGIPTRHTRYGPWVKNGSRSYAQCGWGQIAVGARAQVS